MDFVKDSLQDADVFLFIVDVTDKEEQKRFGLNVTEILPVVRK